MRKIAIVAFMLLPIVGCVSHRHPHGACYSPAEPKIAISVVGYDKSLDAPPVPMTSAQLAISYPFEMRRAALTGEVLATATIEKDGKVSHVVIDHATQPEFGDMVIVGLRRCVFFPTKRSGVAVLSVVQCKIEFLFDED